MLGLFGKKKPKNSKTPAKKSATPSRDQIMKQAMSNVRAARAEIGEEALDQIAEAMMRKENSPLEQARKKIKSLDQERVADNVRAMLYDDD
jgi:hypothetical protein